MDKQAEDDIFFLLNDLLKDSLNSPHKSRFAYYGSNGWQEFFRDNFGTKCAVIPFGNNGSYKWKDYLDDIADFYITFENTLKATFGEKASVWIENIVFDTCDDVYDLVIGVSIGEEYDPTEKYIENNPWVFVQEDFGDNKIHELKELPKEEQTKIRKQLSPYYNERMAEFSEGWLK